MCVRSRARLAHASRSADCFEGVYRSWSWCLGCVRSVRCALHALLVISGTALVEYRVDDAAPLVDARMQQLSE